MLMPCLNVFVRFINHKSYTGVFSLLSNFICSLALLLLEKIAGKLWEFLC